MPPGWPRARAGRIKVPIIKAQMDTEVSSRSLEAYRPVVSSQSLFFTLRGLRHHVRHWHTGGPTQQHLVLLHGWMDSSVSFQFMVDQMGPGWVIHAPDWRGFGLSERPAADSYWFPDYLADLDQLLDELVPDGLPVDVVAHSMGGNVAMLYAGVRPARIRRLINLEGVGMRAARPREAPARYATWLDQVRAGRRLRAYATREALAQRLCADNPRLTIDKALFIAENWSQPLSDGGFEVLGDPAHKLPNPVLYRLSEALACWRQVEASVLWVMSEFPSRGMSFALKPAYERRLAAIRSLERVTVTGAGHMMHHDQPAAVAALIRTFLLK